MYSDFQKFISLGVLIDPLRYRGIAPDQTVSKMPHIDAYTPHGHMIMSYDGATQTIDFRLDQDGEWRHWSEVPHLGPQTHLNGEAGLVARLLSDARQDWQHRQQIHDNIAQYVLSLGLQPENGRYKENRTWKFGGNLWVKIHQDDQDTWHFAGGGVGPIHIQETPFFTSGPELAEFYELLKETH